MEVSLGRAGYILVAQMLQKFELAVSSLREHGRAERLHDLLNRDGLAGKLIFCRAKKAIESVSVGFGGYFGRR